MGKWQVLSTRACNVLKVFLLVSRPPRPQCCNDPCGAYPTAEAVFQAAKGPGCSQWTFNGLSLDDFITSGSVAACRHLKCLSLAPYYMAQMKHCTQKWDRCDDQGPALAMIDTCCQLIGIIGTGLYHLMADVQLTVSQTVDPVYRHQLI